MIDAQTLFERISADFPPPRSPYAGLKSVAMGEWNGYRVEWRTYASSPTHVLNLYLGESVITIKRWRTPLGIASVSQKVVGDYTYSTLFLNAAPTAVELAKLRLFA